MELRNIEYFLTVAAEGSMRAAAKKLGLTQPALTKAMHRLEDEAGVTLFDRRSRGVSLTVYGESFRRHARTIRAGMAEAESEIQALRNGTSGLIRLGAGPSWQSRVIPEAIRRFRAARPDVQLRVTGSTDDVLKAELRAGHFDLVVAAVPEGDEAPDLESRALLVDEYRVIADRSHPLQTARDSTIADLLDYPWILPNPQTYLVRRLEVLMRSHGLTPPKPMVETDILELKLALMRDSTYLSFHAVGHLRSTGVSDICPIPLEPASWKRSAGIITRHGVEANPAAAHLADLIEELCRRDQQPQPRPGRVARTGRVAAG
ncbi:MAG: LysR substrate-binding domain-containing protein [Geminicoccaceae bacterium]